MIPISLSCVVATSPTRMRAEDQLEMIRSTVNSVRLHVGDCIPTVVVCDHHKEADETEPWRQDKRGNVGVEVAREYARYKELLAGDPTFGTVLPLPRHYGFAHAVGVAMRHHCSAASHILVIQHDFIFNDPVRLEVVMGALRDGGFRYVVFPAGRKMVHTARHVSRDYLPSPHQPCVLRFNAYHDKNHVVERDVYLNEVLPHVKLGQFPEDVFNQRMAATGALWYEPFGIGLYCDPSLARGNLTHLKGRQAGMSGQTGQRMRKFVEQALRTGSTAPPETTIPAAPDVSDIELSYPS